MGVSASISLGKITVRTAAQNKLVATDRLMPTSISSSVRACDDRENRLSRKLTAVKEGKRFRRVCKRYRSLARRIECGEEVHEKGDQTQMSWTMNGYVEAKACR